MSNVKSSVYDVAVIGGGLAGGVASYHLARHGLRTVLFEKEAQPHHKVCGEFISGEGVPVIENMGINLTQLGAVAIRKFRLHGPSRSSEATLPQTAMGLSRKILDEEVLRSAASAGVEIRRGAKVKERSHGIEEGGVVSLMTSHGEVQARRLVLASGKSEFKSVNPRQGRDSSMVGFKMHLRLKPSVLERLREHCDLFVFDQGYGGISEIENGMANFCFLIERPALLKTGTDWNSLAGHIAGSNRGVSRFLDGAEPLFERFVTVAHIPYGFLKPVTAELGVYCVGDQMAVIPSLTGNGMTIALRTGFSAAAAIIDSTDVNATGKMQSPNTAFTYQNQMRRKLRGQIEAGYALHRFFKSPKACDMAVLALNVFPGVVDFFFRRTRCRIEFPRLPSRNTGLSVGQVSSRVESKWLNSKLQYFFGRSTFPSSWR